MKLVLISPFPPLRGGISKETETIYDYFNSNGYEIKVINFKRLYPQFLFPGKSQYIINKSYKDDDNIVTILDSINPFTWIKVSEYILKNKIDKVVFRYWHPFFIPAYYFISKKIRKNNAKIKISCIFDNIYPHSYFPFSNFLINFFLKSIDKYFVMSDNTFNQLKRNVSIDDIKQIFLPLKENFGPALNQKACQKELNIQTDFTILFFGLIRDYKGLDVLIKSLNTFKKQNNNFKLIIAGECYTQKNKYLDLITKYNLKSNVLWEESYILDENINVYFTIYLEHL